MTLLMAVRCALVSVLSSLGITMMARQSPFHAMNAEIIGNYLPET